MTSDQKRVASWIAVAFLVAGVLALAWLLYLVGSSNFVDDPGADSPKLHLSWKLALWFIELGTSAKVLFAGILLVITVGVGAAGELYRSTRQIMIISALCIIGIGVCIFLMVLIGDDANGEILRWFSKYETLAELETATNTFLGSLLTWFSTFLVSQLGMSAFKQGGAVRDILSRFSG